MRMQRLMLADPTNQGSIYVEHELLGHVCLANGTRTMVQTRIRHCLHCRTHHHAWACDWVRNTIIGFVMGGGMHPKLKPLGPNRS
jgi:hypothetical protein